MTPPDSLSPQHQLVLDQIDLHGASQADAPAPGLPFVPCLLATIAGGLVAVWIVGAVLIWGAR